MEKETLLSGIKAIIGEPDEAGNYKDLGVTNRTLDAYLDAVAPTIGDEVNDDLFASQAAVIKAIGGQMRHEQADFIKNYKSGSPAKEPKPADQEPPAYIKELSDSMKSLLEENRNLKTRLDDIDKTNVQNRLRKEVVAAMRERGADDEYVLETTMRGIEFDSKKSIEELTTEHLARYDKEFKDCRGEGAVPREAGGGGKSKTSVDEYFERKFKTSKSE